MGARDRGARADHGYHLPVMADEITEQMVADPAGTYLDATMGGGGHAARILEKLGPEGRLLGLDRDMEAVERNKAAFAGEPRVRVERAEFSRLAEFCAPGSLAGALFDLGVSSRQLDAKERGFSFAPGTALDMRMGGEGPAAADLIAGWDEWELASVLRRNADVTEARRLARNILAAIEQGGPMSSDLIRKAVEKLPGVREDNRNSLLARVFQAIRMEVNDEMGQVETGLKAAVACLRSGGRLCVLSYHSVEDRKVKETLAGFEKDCICARNLPVCMCGGNHRRLKKLLRKPGLPTEAERDRNPRARSAKLRVMEKV
ncbi:MAG TPA: 16S rRNA (cytosine(1402)-N(4))-methyltransferase RsmH [Fibrobacteria bacterium]|nr:16S rRNA (cytosine(1402)-N(4))-methyltransferase RsmH [Fibrobacteria bacterium]